MTRAVQVPRERGEELRKALEKTRAVDRRVRIAERGEFVQVPLSKEPGEAEMEAVRRLGGVLVELGEAVPREVRESPFVRIRAALDIPEAAKGLLPEKWERLGDVLVVKLDPGLDVWAAAIGEAYGRELGAKTVLREVAAISGQFREPRTERLCGGGTVTTHLENGVRYRLDAARLMYASGNIDERQRMATISKPGEVVVDMFAGIGYFTLPLAKYSRPERVVAYEINPVSHSYLVENVSLNALDNVVPRLGDCQGADEGVADRVLMGYVGTTHLYLRKAVRILRGAGGVIHYHETCPNALLWERPRRRVADAAEAEGAEARVLLEREVKSYAPGVTHVVLDVEIRK